MMMRIVMRWKYVSRKCYVWMNVLGLANGKVSTNSLERSRGLLSSMSENTTAKWGRSVPIAFHSQENMTIANPHSLLPN